MCTSKKSVVPSILFRGKDIKTGEWVFGSYVHGDMTAGNLIVDHAIKPKGCYPIEVDIKTIGQYRPDIKAFDGDWITAKTNKTPSDHIEGFIDFQDMECVVEQNSNFFPVCSFAVIDRLSIKLTGKNIHDNPELLEKD